MLQLTRLNGDSFALNPDLIERAEATPDTVVTLVNGSKYVIHESLDELILRVRDYRAELVLAAQAGEVPTPAEQTRHSSNRFDVLAHALEGGTVVQLHHDLGGQ